MYYVDSQRTTTRRDSSLITSSRRNEDRDEYATVTTMTARGGGPYSTYTSYAPSGVDPYQTRTPGTVRKEITTVLFEALLEYIVDSWEVIDQPLKQDSIDKRLSEIIYVPKRRKSAVITKTLKPSTKAKSRSKLQLVDMDMPNDRTNLSWWNQPDEKAIVHFKNGNVYEGKISWKTMNGEGRFQWTDGCIYLGNFNNNEIIGRGTFSWKDDAWYTGEFVGNLRHGKGLYVDPRQHRFYTGDWYCGTKHGKGFIAYKHNVTYDGDWVFNQRHGFGIHKYGLNSMYQGDWNDNVKNGKGVMIWPNSDYYTGEWKDGLMSGCGQYVWQAHQNFTMSCPSLKLYRGCWSKGKRNSHGFLLFGLGTGAHYKGEFIDDKKHGMGKLVTHRGLILKHKQLFVDDNITLLSLEDMNEDKNVLTLTSEATSASIEPFDIEMVDYTTGLQLHVQDAIKNLDRQQEQRISVINKYVKNNRVVNPSLKNIKYDIKEIDSQIDEGMILFETMALLKAIACYQTDLKNIYYKYATICNTKEIYFKPILIRLYLWQFFYDCGLNEKGLILVDIDNMFYEKKTWLIRTRHEPYDKIFFWQFCHFLTAIAIKLYAKKCLPGPRPDTIVGTAVRHFIDCDVLPNVGRCKGYLPQNYGQFVPLESLYQLYRVLGEPHTVRKFLCAVHRSRHLYIDYPQPPSFDAPDESLPFGCNAYVFGDWMTFLPDEFPGNYENETFEKLKDTILYNFGNLSTKTIIIIFKNLLFPNIYDLETGWIRNLDIPMTFFEFYQVFMACTEESIHVSNEEKAWREMLEDNGSDNLNNLNYQ